jgi:hypothetical protein
VMSGGTFGFWMMPVKRSSRLAAELGGEFRLGLDLLGLLGDGSARGGVVEAASTTSTTSAGEADSGVHPSVSSPSGGGWPVRPAVADMIG